MATPIRYVHGYTAQETRRLGEQADVLADLVHADTGYPPGSRVLEIGCGVGAQTVHLIARSPGSDIVALDISAESLALASDRVAARHPDASVSWRRADARELPFPTRASITPSSVSCWNISPIPSLSCGNCTGCSGPEAPSR